MKVRLTPRATRDLVDIADYIRTHNPAAAERVRSSILNTLQLLVQFPYVGRAQKIEGVRKLVVRRLSHLLYYATDEPADEAVVLTIQHAARQREHQDS